VSASEKFHEWPNKATHDRFVEQWKAFCHRNYGADYPVFGGLYAQKLLPVSGFSGCCGTRGGGVHVYPGASYISHEKLVGGVAKPVPEGYGFIVIRDKDYGDIQISWQDV
jgi:hypothetical protein